MFTVLASFSFFVVIIHELANDRNFNLWIQMFLGGRDGNHGGLHLPTLLLCVIGEKTRESLNTGHTVCQQEMGSRRSVTSAYCFGRSSYTLTSLAR